MPPTTSEPEPELPADWWSASDVLRYLASVGRPIELSTWLTYVAREQAPKHARKFGRTRVWEPAAVKAWHESSQGPGRPRLSSQP